MKKSIVAVMLVFASLFSFSACRKINGDGSFLIETKNYIVDSDGVTQVLQTRTNEAGETEYYYTDLQGNAVTVARKDVKSETTRVQQTKKGAESSGDESVPPEMESLFNDMINGEGSMEDLAEATDASDQMELSEDIIPEEQIKEVTVPTASDGRPQRDSLLDTYGATLKGDTFTFKFKAQADVPTEDGGTGMITVPITLMKNGNKMYVETKYPVSANSAVTVAGLIGDNAAYLMIPSMRGYISMPVDDLSDALNLDGVETDMLDETDAGNYVSSGEVTIDGQTYSVDIYERDGVEERFYFKDNALKRMERIDGDSKSVIEITELVSTVDNTKFRVPLGYIDYSKVLGGSGLNLDSIMQ